MSIAFVDLGAQYEKIKTEVHAAIDEVIESKAFIQGRFAKKFAEDFLKVHGGSFGVGCANGTTAITLALRGLGIGPEDEVLVPNNTFIGSIEPIAEVGARPVLVDSLPGTYTMNLQELESKITSQTKAIIPVHLYGHPENMKQVMELAKKHQLKVIEDSAQAHCAKFDGRAVGTFGDAATFSFYPGKNLGAYGDAGFVMSEDEKLINHIECLLNHGRKDKYLHDHLGFNFRIDGIQSAILSVKSKYIQEWSKRRQQVAQWYDKKLSGKGLGIIEPFAQAEPVYHLYVVQVSNRDQVMNALKEKGIATGIHYPVTMNRQPCLNEFGYGTPGEFPVSESAAERLMSLPIFPELTEDQANMIADEFLKVAEA